MEQSTVNDSGQFASTMAFYLFLIAIALGGFLWVKVKIEDAGGLRAILSRQKLKSVSVTGGVISPVAPPLTPEEPQIVATFSPADKAGALALAGRAGASTLQIERTSMLQQVPVLTEQELFKQERVRFLNEMERMGVPLWFLILLDSFFHLLIVGPTGSGKSVFVRAMITVLSYYGKVIVLDPHIPFQWEGVEVVGAGRNYNALSYALDWINEEMKERYEKACRDRHYKPDHLYIIVDEWPSIATHCGESAKGFIVEMAQEARKVNMHIIVLTQSRNVADLGIEGSGPVRENFTTIYLGKAAEKVCKDFFSKFKEPWPCAISLAPDESSPADRSFVPALAQYPVSPRSRFVIPNLPDADQAVEVRKQVVGRDRRNQQLDITALERFPLAPERPDLSGVAAELAREEQVAIDNGKGYDPTRDQEKCVRAVALIHKNPDMSQRQLAEQLYGDGNGRYSTWTSQILKYLWETTGVTLNKKKAEFEADKPPF